MKIGILYPRISHYREEFFEALIGRHVFFISDNANLIDFALSTILIHMFMVFVLSIVWYRKFFRV